MWSDPQHPFDASPICIEAIQAFYLAVHVVDRGKVCADFRRDAS